MEWSLDGARLATTSADRTVRISNLGRQELNAMELDADLLSMVWLPDGQNLMLLKTDRTIQIWDTTKK